MHGEPFVSAGTSVRAKPVTGRREVARSISEVSFHCKAWSELGNELPQGTSPSQTQCSSGWSLAGA